MVGSRCRRECGDTPYTYYQETKDRVFKTKRDVIRLGTAIATSLL